MCDEGVGSLERCSGLASLSLFECVLVTDEAVCVDMCTDMCTDVCADTCTDMCADTCTDMRVERY